MTEQEAIELTDKVKKALEKQIPKKVLFCRNMMTKETVIICPSCSRIVEGTNYHCWFCGQKLDWGEEE